MWLFSSEKWPTCVREWTFSWTWKYHIYNIKQQKDHVDIHFILLQILDSKGFPWHLSPPWAGAGESQVLCLDSIPAPQVWEHPDQLLQPPQEPCWGLSFLGLGQTRWTFFLERFIVLVESYWEPSGREIVIPHLGNIWNIHYINECLLTSICPNFQAYILVQIKMLFSSWRR